MTKPIELIHWIDSAGHSGWHKASEQTYEPMTCQTAGFLIHETEISLTLALNIALDDGADFDVGETITIPKVAIVCREFLGPTEDGQFVHLNRHVKTTGEPGVVGFDQSSQTPVTRGAIIGVGPQCA